MRAGRNVTANVVVTGDGATRSLELILKKHLSMERVLCNVRPISYPIAPFGVRGARYSGVGCEASMSPKGGLATFDSISATMLV